jgi:hypothetical protein
MAKTTCWMRALSILVGMLACPISVNAAEVGITAREHYQAGQREFGLGHWDAAIAEFERAYVLHADPAFLFNLAQCYDRKGDARHAIDLFRAYLNNAPSNSLRQAIEERIKLLQRQLDSAEAAKPAPLPPVPSAAIPPAPSAPSGTSPSLSPQNAPAVTSSPASSLPQANALVTSPNPGPEAGPLSPSGPPPAPAAPCPTQRPARRATGKYRQPQCLQGA